MDKFDDKKLDQLFNDLRNEAPKTTFFEAKQRFLNSAAASTGKMSLNGKTTILNLKNGLIMILTVSTITAGVMLFINSFSTPINKTQLTIEQSDNLTKDDSIVVVEEHKRVVNDYLQKVQHLDVDLSEYAIATKKLETVGGVKDLESEIVSDQPIRTDRIDQNNILDSAYRFPHLGAKEIKAHKKQKALMLKRLTKLDKKKYAFIPSGELSIKDEKFSIQSFYIQTTEVTNLEYRTFLTDLLIDGRKDAFLIAKPDQSRWVKDYPYAFNKPMEEHYFSHPAYNDYPVVAISRKGAEMYCNWLSEEGKKLDSKNNKERVSIHIPSKNEWIYAAQGGLGDVSYSWGGPYLRNSKGCFLANYKPGVVDSLYCDVYSKTNRTMDNVQLNEATKKNLFSADGGFFTVKVDSYNPNNYGLYCMNGNVAEMVYDENENNMPGTRGGSWSSIAYEIQLNGPDKFKGMVDASVNIGFRPVISHIDKNPKKGKLVGVLGNRLMAPPGTIKIEDDLYMDIVEITNMNWREYTYWQSKTFGKTSDEYKNALPDTMVWNEKNMINVPFVKHYYSHPSYNDYPVIGISYEQAVAFCKWRTDRVKELYAIKSKKKPNLRFPTNFSYRLPTKKEWERVAKAGYSDKITKKMNTGVEDQPFFNLKNNKTADFGVAGKLNNNSDITAPSKSYWPNNFGVYNIIGNVAEMIDQKGIAKGGSWKHTAEEANLELDITYTSAQNWLGFRCVCEIND